MATLNFTGKIAKILHYNTETKWCIFTVNNLNKELAGFKDTVKVCGNSNFKPQYGIYVEVIGQTSFNTNYNETEVIANLITPICSSKLAFTSIFKSLQTSKNKKVIPNEILEKVWNVYKDNTVSSILFNRNDFLNKNISGVTSYRKKQILSFLDENRNIFNLDELSKFCALLGFPSNAITKILTYEEESKKPVETIKKEITENIYGVIDYDCGITFDVIDTVAINLGYQHNDIRRLKAAIPEKFFKGLSEKSSTGLPINDFLNKFNYDLKINCSEKFFNDLIKWFNTEIKKNFFEIKDGIIYSSSYLKAEKNIARDLLELSNLNANYEFDQKVIDEKCSELGFELNGDQRNAVNGVLKKKFSVLCGCPGTGKTTVINVIKNIFEHYNYKCILLATTGKAAKRMSECCHSPSKTVHSFLWFLRKQDAELPDSNTVIIIDEISMSDICLFYSILNVIMKTGASFIICGDKDQIPSIRPGNLLGDIIESGKTPVFELMQIMRQNENSGIVDLCRRINKGEYFSTNIYKDTSDVSFSIKPVYSFNIDEEIIKPFVKLYREGKGDVTAVISPYNKGEYGTDKLNIRISQALADAGLIARRINLKFKKYRVGDKVMQRVNNPERGLVNGDIGKVKSFYVNEDNCWKMIVTFPDQELGEKDVEYFGVEASEELSLAYCFTVHKAQGSEYDNVFLILLDTCAYLYNRKTAYTAISRAKKNVKIFTSVNAFGVSTFETCVATSDNARITTLRQYLVEGVDELQNDFSDSYLERMVAKAVYQFEKNSETS